MIKRSTFLIASGVSVLVITSASSQAAVTTLYSSNFNAPTYVDGALNDGTTSQDGWLATDATGTNNILVSNTATNGFVTLGGAGGQDVRHTFTSQTSGSVLALASINLSGVKSAGAYFLHLGPGSTGNFAGQVYAKSTTGGFVLGVAVKDESPVYGTTVLTLGQSYDVLLKYDIVTGAANDMATLYVNPINPDGTGSTTYAASTNLVGGSDPASIGGVYLRQGGSTTSPALTLDNLNVASIVPEPATLAALGLAGLSLIRRRKA